MDKDTYRKLLTLEKILNNNKIDLAKFGNQKSYPSHGIFAANHKFETIMNCKGHKKNKLSLMMNSNDGIMMRFDIIGKPHQGNPTPHLHIFNGENTTACEFVPTEQLPSPFDEIVVNPSDFQRNLKFFFIYNNVELRDVIFYDPLV